MKIEDNFGVSMAIVPAGEFKMGSEDGNSNETPVHAVYLDDFYIDIYEVSNELYKKCVDVGICNPPTTIASRTRYPTRYPYYGGTLFANYPVIYVDWEMAEKFCEWRDARLPTEAEWEKAARGGHEQNSFPWGNSTPNCILANHTEYPKFDKGPCIGDGDTVPVDSYKPNDYGIFNMAGNVFEYVADLYSENYYSESPYENPAGPGTGKYHVVRGGSWGSDSDELRVSYREARRFPTSIVGFRCVRSASTP